jgi:hypothetical protein
MLPNDFTPSQIDLEAGTGAPRDTIVLSNASDGGVSRRRSAKCTAQSKKVIKPSVAGEIEKAQISVNEGEDLYREIRVENVVADEKCEKARLKPGEDCRRDNRGRLGCNDKETHLISVTSLGTFPESAE